MIPLVGRPHLEKHTNPVRKRIRFYSPSTYTRVYCFPGPAWVNTELAICLKPRGSTADGVLAGAAGRDGSHATFSGVCWFAQDTLWGFQNTPRGLCWRQTCVSKRVETLGTVGRKPLRLHPQRLSHKRLCDGDPSPAPHCPGESLSPSRDSQDILPCSLLTRP